MKSEKTLKEQVIHGSFWLFGGNLISKTISFISTLILAKLLSPADFGIIGYGFLVVQTIGLFREMGFNSALIYQKDDLEAAISSAFWISVLWSFILYLVIYIAAPLLSVFFREQALINILRVLSLSLILNSLASVPLSLLEKEINFKIRIIPDIFRLTLYSIITTLFALLGYRYWSFVIGTLCSDIVYLVIAFYLNPIRISVKVDFVVLKKMFGFGKNIMKLGVIYFGIRNIDDFFIGRMLGTTPLGIYQFSYRLANIPATNISNVLGRILYPSFVRLSNKTGELKNAFLKTFRYVSFIIIPLTFYIILVVPDFINSFYRNWEKAILPMQLIAYFGGVRALGSGMGSIFFAKGRPKLLIPIAYLQLGFLIIVLYPAIHFYGIVGVCLALNISITLSFFLTYDRLRHLIPIRYKDLLANILVPLIISLVLYTILTGIFSDNLNRIVSFGIKLILFPILYLLISLKTSDTLIDIWQDLRNR